MVSRDALRKVLLVLVAALAIGGASETLAQTPDAARLQAPVGTGATDPAAVSQPVDQGAAKAVLLLDTGDLLDVRVFDTPELSAKVHVDENGNILLPLGGAVGARV